MNLSSPCDFFSEHYAYIRCPKCLFGQLNSNDENRVYCSNCTHKFSLENNIPLLFWPHDSLESTEDVTKKIRAFYEETPFPNYDDFEDVSSLLKKARQGGFARALNNQLPYGIGVLEVGCGTGQLGAFLSVANRTVFSTDITINSLKLGQEFKEKNGLTRVHFLQMNLFRPAFLENSFHVVICNGVLHHTADPRGGFQAISRLVRPTGYIIIGLYHKYGRLVTDFRRILLKLTGDRLKFLDKRVKNDDSSYEKRNAWFRDQYKNPHESKHTFSEILEWFDEEGFDFINSIPKTIPGHLFDPEKENLFELHPPGTPMERFAAETTMPLFQKDEGGLFIMIGKKRGF
tara:strand:- start:1061 stop:2095 length:1035 start_codon:yes stop_codon:yes gene_type:complete